MDNVQVEIELEILRLVTAQQADTIEKLKAQVERLKAQVRPGRSIWNTPDGRSFEISELPSIEND
jgi:hypothetical protein